MLRAVLSVLLKTFIAAAIFILQIAAANLLPPPWSRINLIFIAAMWILIFNQQKNFLWYIFALSLISELFHSTPLGLTTAALLITIAALDWLLINIFTNRFFLMVFVAGIAGVVVFRVTYLILSALWHLIAGAPFEISASLAYDLLFESLVNAGLLTILYLIPAMLIKKMNPRYLTGRY